MGVSQSRLARLAGTHQQHISRIEKGLVDPNLATLDAVVRALGLTLTVEAETDRAEDRLDRLRAFARFNEWERLREREVRREDGWALAGAWLRTYRRLHPADGPELRRDQAEVWKEWRRRLSRCPP